MTERKTIDDTAEELRSQLREIELDVTAEGVTLSQLMREGTRVTEQQIGGWGDGVHTACALTSALIAAKARNLTE
jgi:hypothetical protein